MICMIPVYLWTLGRLIIVTALRLIDLCVKGEGNERSYPVVNGCNVQDTILVSRGRRYQRCPALA